MGGVFFIKLLLSDQLAGILIGTEGQQIRNIKRQTGANLIFSPHGRYYPGTVNRLFAVSSSSLQPVLDVVEIVVEFVIALAYEDMSGETKPTVKIAVPRSVIGSLIGRKGMYIQTIRVETGAHVHVSPLFVPAVEACSERIVTVSSAQRRNLLTAIFNIVQKINEHCDNSSCRNVVYVRRANGTDGFDHTSPVGDSEFSVPCWHSAYPVYPSSFTTGPVLPVKDASPVRTTPSYALPLGPITLGVHQTYSNQNLISHSL